MGERGEVNELEIDITPIKISCRYVMYVCYFGMFAKKGGPPSNKHARKLPCKVPWCTTSVVSVVNVGGRWTDTVRTINLAKVTIASVLGQL